MENPEAEWLHKERMFVWLTVLEAESAALSDLRDWFFGEGL